MTAATDNAKFRLIGPTINSCKRLFHRVHHFPFDEPWANANPAKSSTCERSRKGLCVVSQRLIQLTRQWYDCWICFCFDSWLLSDSHSKPRPPIFLHCSRLPHKLNHLCRSDSKMVGLLYWSFRRSDLTKSLHEFVNSSPRLNLILDLMMSSLLLNGSAFSSNMNRRNPRHQASIRRP